MLEKAMENFTFMCINTQNFKQEYEILLKAGHRVPG